MSVLHTHQGMKSAMLSGRWHGAWSKGCLNPGNWFFYVMLHGLKLSVLIPVLYQ